MKPDKQEIREKVELMTINTPYGKIGFCNSEVEKYTDQILALFPPRLSEGEILQFLRDSRNMPESWLQSLAHALAGRIEKGTEVEPDIWKITGDIDFRVRSSSDNPEPKKECCKCIDWISPKEKENNKCNHCGKPIVGEKECKLPFSQKYGLKINGKWTPLSELPTDINELSKLLKPEPPKPQVEIGELEIDIEYGSGMALCDKPVKIRIKNLDKLVHQLRR